MRLKVSESQFLEYRYELKPNDHMLGFSVRSQGLSSIFNTSQDVQLNWKFDAYRHGKSISFENRYTRLSFEHEGEKTNKLSQTGDDEESVTDVSWISFRQHFFSSILEFPTVATVGLVPPVNISPIPQTAKLKAIIRIRLLVPRLFKDVVIFFIIILYTYLTFLYKYKTINLN